MIRDIIDEQQTIILSLTKDELNDLWRGNGEVITEVDGKTIVLTTALTRDTFRKGA